MSGLREAIAKALEPYDIPTGAWTTAEKAEPIDAILAAIEPLVVERSELEQVGWACPHHGVWFQEAENTPEWCDDCGQHPLGFMFPVYRLRQQ